MLCSVTLYCEFCLYYCNGAKLFHQIFTLDKNLFCLAWLATKSLSLIFN